MQRIEPDADARPSLGALYREHADLVWRAVRRLGIPEAHAEDAVHEVFLVAGRKLPEFTAECSASAWLYAISRRVCANLRRASERSRRRAEAAGPVVTPLSMPDEAMARRDAASLVEAFLGTLPDPQREVFMLVDIEGMSGPEVAALADMPLGSVYSRLRLARRRFAGFVEAQCPARRFA